MMLLSAEMPVDVMAELLDEHDTRLWRVVMHYVEQAHAKSDWSAVRRIAVDETSARRGHRYVTNMLDAETSRLLFNWSRAAVPRPWRLLPRRCARTAASPPRSKPSPWGYEPGLCQEGATALFPQATIIFDKFHLMMLAGQALDEVRRCLQGQGAGLKGALWSLRGNAWNLRQERQEQRHTLCRQYTKLGRAMSLRETLQAPSTPAPIASLPRRTFSGGVVGPRAVALSPFALWPRPSASIGRASWPTSTRASPPQPSRPSMERSSSPSAWLADSKTSSTSEPPPTTEPASST
jgi:Transposase